MTFYTRTGKSMPKAITDQADKVGDDVTLWGEGLAVERVLRTAAGGRAG